VWNTGVKINGKEKQLPEKNVLYKSHKDSPGFEHWHSQSEACVMA